MAKYLSYAGLTELASQFKAYVTGQIQALDKTIFTVVTELPTSGIDEDKIYVVPAGTTADNNLYVEYIYANGEWEKVGEAQAEVDLSDYYTKSEVDSLLSAKANSSDVYTKTETDSAISSAVDAVDLTPYAKTADVDEALATKADASDVYTKTEVDSSLSTKADASALADYALSSDLVNYVKTSDIEDITTAEIDALFA